MLVLAAATPALAECPCTAFAPTDTPAVPASPDAAIEVGVKLRTTLDGYITGVRFYKGEQNVGKHLGHLWTSTGTLLAEATFTGESATGWQEVAFATPVQVTANTTYIASYHSIGYYAFNGAYFTTAVENGPLRLLQEGEDGSNGVFTYGATTQFPTSSFNSSNYWVDVVFDTEIRADPVPPTVIATSPVANALGVPVGSSLTASFSEALDPATVTGATFQLRDASGATVPAAVSYDVSSRTATLAPSAPLAYSATYTAVLAGGGSTPRVADLAGNALAAEYAWSFTTTTPPTPPNQGPGGPILVVSSSTNPFSRYPVELLRAEGLNLFAASDIGSLTAGVPAGVDVVILGDMTLTAGQVTMLSDWVTAGGTLIALHPDKQLAPLLGLTDATATLSNQYLQVNTSAGAGVGIAGQTMQFHGTADLYTLNGATANAMLYSDANTATAFPAVTTRAVGSNGGQAIAFTYDLARSIVYTRQGNPAWAGQNRDNALPQTTQVIRSDDLFYGNDPSDPQPDWVDPAKIAIPQADEQQRLLANLVLTGNLHKKPLPRFWYLPKGKKAALVLTGDNHGSASMTPRMDEYRQLSPAGCSPDDWECVRASGYDYVNAHLLDAQTAFYNSLGFEIGLHVLTNCADWTPSTLETFYAGGLATFRSAYPSLPAQSTNRTHCVAWSDWSTQADVEVAHGIRFDTNYYYFPPAWVNNRPGVFTGSGMPMRFARLDGSIIDCYQLATQMTDESGQTFPLNPDSLFNRALDARGYYGAFCANMHYDNPGDDADTRALINSALTRGLPVVSSLQMLNWIDGRNGSTFGGLSWSDNALSFSIAVATGARNLQGMLPMRAAFGPLLSIARNGTPVTFTTQTIKGIDYAFFPADPGSYLATYSDTTPPTISAITAAPGTSGKETIAWTTDEPSNSRVDYGVLANALSSNASDPSLVSNHSITLSGLAPATTYYYRVTSVDPAFNSATAPNPPALPLSFTTPANIAPVAVASGVPQSGTAPLAVSFSGAASTDADGDSLTFGWTFGDGGTASGRLASHTYAAGSYAAILTVDDGRGGTDTASVAVAVAQAFPVTPVLDNFNRANGAPGANWIDQPSRFAIATNVLAPKTGDGYMEWNPTTFGPNQEAFVTLTTVATASRELNLMLKTQGSTWSAGHIEVSHEPESGVVTVFTYTPPATWRNWGTINGSFASGDRLGARALSDGTVQIYKNGTLLGKVSVTGWSFAALGGRIGISTSNSSTSRLDDFGGGNVTLTPNRPPVAVAVGLPPSGPAPLAVSFSGATSTDADGDSLTFGWTFGDGGTATGRRVNHTYLAAGNYSAVLTVNDGRGGTSTASVAISVTPAPPNTPPVAVAVGVPQSGTAPLAVSFSGAASTDANGDSLTFGWTFGDGGTATGRLASHTYSVAGSYAAILTVNDGHGGTDTASVAISVAPPPVTFPLTPVLDNFNRADGAVGPNWIDQPARFTIAANVLAPGTGEGYMEWSPATFGPNQEVFATLSTVAAASRELNLMLKTQGATWSAGHIEVSYARPSTAVTIYTLTPPETWNAWGTITGVTFAAGNQFGARSLSDGTVQVYRNGTLLGTASVAGWAFAAAGGRIGLSFSTASTSRFDDFGGGNVPGASALLDPPSPFAKRVPGSEPPDALFLSAAFPNPTAGGVALSIALPREDAVSLSIVDIQGREVWRAPSQRYAAGRWTLSWDGHTSHGPAGTGVYLARVQVGGLQFLRRIALIR